MFSVNFGGNNTPGSGWICDCSGNNSTPCKNPFCNNPALQPTTTTGQGDLGSNAMKGWPVLFHHVHSPNIQISLDKRRARRVESFCKGICFSNRPVVINERVYLKFAEVSTSWSGVLRFGYTARDPTTVNPGTLPRYACPDLTNKPGCWGKALGERYCEEGVVLFFYLTRNGDVMYGVNGEEKGVFFSGVSVNMTLWVLVDIYGNTVAMEFVDGRQLNNLSPSGGQPPPNVADITQTMQSLPAAPTIPLPTPPTMLNVSQGNATPARVNTAPSGRTMPNTVSMPPIRYHSNVTFTPLPFHVVMGRNVCLSTDRTIAVRLVDEYCNGYVFASHPIRPGDKVVIQVLSVDRAYVGGLAFGMTSCDPSAVKPEDLPDDSDLLLDRPEYWVVNKDVCSSPEIGDELTFHLTLEGEVKYSKNGRTIGTLMFVDKTLPLWPFFDVYGSTQKIKILGIPGATVVPPALQPRQSGINRGGSSAPNLQSGPSLTVSLPPRNRQTPSPTAGQRSTPATSHSTTPPPRPPPLRATVSTPLVSTTPTTPPVLPPKMMSRPIPPIPLPEPLIPTPSSLTTTPKTAATSSAMLRANTPSANDYAPRQSQTPPLSLSRLSQSTAQSTSQSQHTAPSAASISEPSKEMDDNACNECTVCFEKDVDCVIYTCGHMCLCYECAIDIKQNQGALCPMCRQEIKDIIKIYRS